MNNTKKLTIYFLKGLPASGKSTYAKQLVIDHPGQYKRINKDDLRAMLDAGKWSKPNEQYVLEVRNALIRQSLGQGFDVIVDDTNLAPKHKEVIESIATEFKAQVIEKFFDTPLQECIDRDRQRTGTARVGVGIIKKMYNEFLKKDPVPLPPVAGLPDAIIVDLDGTLAFFGNMNPYDRNYLNDKVNEPVARLVTMYHDRGYKVIIVSGRKTGSKSMSMAWLKRHSIPYDYIHIPRADDDDRKDTIIKQEVYDQYIKGKFNIEAVIDDRPQVCRLWYSLGLPLLKVGDPDAEF